MQSGQKHLMLSNGSQNIWFLLYERSHSKCVQATRTQSANHEMNMFATEWTVKPGTEPIGSSLAAVTLTAFK